MENALKSITDNCIVYLPIISQHHLKCNSHPQGVACREAELFHLNWP